MRAVIQKVTHAEVDVLNGNTRETAGRISDGLTVLLGVGTEDTEADARYIADKIATLRIFEDGDGKLNRSLQDAVGAVLLVRNSHSTPMPATAAALLFPPPHAPNRPNAFIKPWRICCADTA